MAGTAKRSKSEGSCDGNEAQKQHNAIDWFTKHAYPDTILMRSLSRFLTSPYDWRSLRRSSHHFLFLSNDPESPLIKSVKDFKAELGSWSVEQVFSEAARGSPDGDKVFFALRMRRLINHANASDIEKMLDIVKVILKAPSVLGWPPIDDNESLRALHMLDRLRDDDQEAYDYVSEDHERKKTIEDRGVVELVVKSMERWPSSAGIQEKGCFLFSKLSGPRDLLARCILLVRNAMDRHPQIPDVQAAACKALKDFWIPNAKFILSVEAVQAVCIAMESHPTSLHVNFAACEFFRWILPSSRNCKRSDRNEKLFDQIRGTAAMGLILSAANAHTRNRRFQRDIWILLDDILCHIKGSNFFSYGGIAAMKSALTRYDRNNSRWNMKGDQITSAVFKALRTACAMESVADHIDEEFMHLVISALGNFSPCSLSESITLVICEVFGHLAQNARWGAWLADKGVVEPIVKFMEHQLDRNPRGNPEYTAAAAAIMHLIQREPLQVDGAIRAVVRAMIVMPDELKMQVQGCAFLASLKWNPMNAAKASAFHACDAVIAAMIAHAEYEDMQAQGCLALTTLLLHDANSAVMAKVGGVGPLVNAIEKFSDNTVVQEHGREILKVMSTSAGARKHSNELRVVALLL